MNLRPVIFWSHLAAGVTAGLVILIMSVTGTLLMWRIDALVVLVLALMLAGARAFARKLLVEKLWGKSGLAENRLLFLADWAVAPLAIAMNAACGWSAISMKRTTWAGITYEVRGPRSVDVLTR